MNPELANMHATRDRHKNTCRSSEGAAYAAQQLIDSGFVEYGEDVAKTVAMLWEARADLAALRAALQHERDCMDAAKAEIARLESEAARR